MGNPYFFNNHESKNVRLINYKLIRDQNRFIKLKT